MQHEDPRIQYAVPMIASPSIRLLLSHRAKSSEPPLDVDIAIPPSLASYLEANDPANQSSEVWMSKHILICSGGSDSLVPFVEGGSKDFYLKLQNIGIDITAFVQEGVGHKITSEMLDHVSDWLAHTVLQVSTRTKIVSP